MESGKIDRDSGGTSAPGHARNFERLRDHRWRHASTRIAWAAATEAQDAPWRR
jgi:hypothetical protein